MKIRVNGKEELCDGNKHLLDLVQDRGLDPGRIVVEYNRQIIPNDKWEDTNVCDGDVVEMVSFMGGG